MNVTDSNDRGRSVLEGQLHAAYQMEADYQSSGMVPDDLKKHIRDLEVRLAELDPPITKEGS